MNTPSNEDVVKFQGVDILTFTQNDNHLIAIKPLCESFGIQWRAQYHKIQRDDLFSSTVSVTDTVGADGKQREMTCLPLEVFPMWLARINTSRVENPFAAKLIMEFQKKATEVLFEYFMGNPQELEKEVSNLKSSRSFDAAAIIKLYIEKIFGDSHKFYDVQWWWRLYQIERSYKAVAAYTDSSASTISKWIKRYDHYLDATRHERWKVNHNFDGASLYELGKLYDSFGTMLKAVKANDRWLMQPRSSENEMRTQTNTGQFVMVRKNNEVQA